MAARIIAKRVYPLAAAMAAGAFVYLWLTQPKPKS